MLARALLCILPVVSACAAAPNQPLTPAQQLELKTLIGQLVDPARAAKTKLEAAELLLSKTYPQAVEAMKAFLADPSNRPAQVAAAQAIASQGRGRREFIAPLMKMLTGEEASVRGPAGRALATYKNHGVTEQLVGIALDRARDRDVRLVTISALQRVLDKAAVDALIRLLDDADEGIRNAATAALAKLTSIRAFGSDARRWKRWWRQNRHKARSEWLADLADSLGRANAALEAENARLRERLGKAMVDLYTTTPADQRQQILLAFLKDPQAEVRWAGVKIVDRRIAANESISKEIRLQVRALLSDPDQRVRQASALLTANLADGDAVAVLLKRLAAEDIALVRQALLTALGQLRDRQALPAVLKEVSARDPDVAAAAAVALARLVAKKPLEGRRHTGAVQALVARYRAIRGTRNGVQLREALLTAMGVLGDKAFMPVLRGALKDSAARVRLAAVNALATLGDGQGAKDLAPLVDDPDRGVRQAAIAALGTLAGARQLPVILKRTDPAVETDPAVRQQAWDVIMAVLAKADADVLATVLAGLRGRKDAAGQRIRIMQMLVASLTAAGSDELPAARRALGEALVKAGRPAEAAPVLAEAYRQLSKAGSPQAAAAWLAWLGALLAADDVSTVKVLAAQTDDAAFAQGLKHLHGRLAALDGQKNWATVILLASAAARDLRDRLGQARLAALQKVQADAQSKLTAADQKRVVELVAQLAATSEARQKEATAKLQAMGDRAVKPLVAQLRKLVAGDKLRGDTEKVILAVLGQIAPKLTGYDPAAAKEEKLKLLRAWEG